MKSLLLVTASLGLVYLLLLGFYALMQRNLIYYPTTLSIEQAQGQAMALGGKPWFDDDGDWIGWRVESGDTAAVDRPPRALVFHGNAGMALNRAYYADLLTQFTASGPWEVLVFEYPGYGPRQGRPGETEFITAALEAVDRLLAQAPEPLLIIGESIGSGVASTVAQERPEAVASLLLITPFDSMVNIARYHMPYLPAGLLLRDRYDNLAALNNYRGPLVVITAEDDTIVPSAFAEPLIAQHDGPLLHGIQVSAGHNSLHFRSNRAPWPSVDRFLAAHQR